MNTVFAISIDKQFTLSPKKKNLILIQNNSKKRK